MGDFQMRKTYFPTGSSGNFHAAGWVRRTYRIKKTSGKRHPLARMVNVRWRDESVALPDTGSLVAARASPDT